MNDETIKVLIKEFGIYYEAIIEFEFGVSLQKFIDEVFEEVMGETIEEYIENENKYQGYIDEEL